MLNLSLGTNDKTREHLRIAREPFFYIGDAAGADQFAERFPRARVFDPHLDHFNPFRPPSRHFPRQLTDIINARSAQGENTLTRQRNNYLIRAAARLLLPVRGVTLQYIFTVLSDAAYRDKLIAHCEDDYLQRQWFYIRNNYKDEDMQSAVQQIADLLESDLVRKVLCHADVKFWPGTERRSVIARLDRATIGDDDGLIIALLLIGQTTSHTIIIDDFGFYGRPMHTTLIRQERLIAGLNFLDELPLTLRSAVLTMRNMTALRMTLPDAHQLASYFGVNPTTLTDIAHDEYLPLGSTSPKRP